ncbi:MAG: glycosyltransferase [Phycisphaerae bacterium]|nr:glycosyltransferase [Phycisphaerae bacterium]
MRVFMLGWEFPPFISGGLGTACYGLTRGLDEIGVQVCFVLPTAIPIGQVGSSHVDIRTPDDLPSSQDYEPVAEEDVQASQFQNLEIHRLAATLQPYSTPPAVDAELRRLRAQAQAQAAKLCRLRMSKQQQARGEKTKALLRDAINGNGKSNHVKIESQASLALPKGSLVVGGAGQHYEGDLMDQIHRYAGLACRLALVEDFDVIHAHDWMTYPAAMAVAAATGKPLVVHVHSTEFDRSGQNVNQQVYDIERAGMWAAAKVVCVSHLTRNIAINRYGIPAEKTEVVYNAVDLPATDEWKIEPIGRDEKIVLFLGRITMQKGPEYFLQAAKKVVGKYPNVRFVVAGSGDMIRNCIELAADLHLGRHVTFTGFLRGQDVKRIFEMADLYVMPSVSEPFGIAPLEAMSHNVPVIISKQSGVSEVLTHVLKVDFWDIDEMANKILAVLHHEPLQKTLSQHGQFELAKFSWEDSATQLKGIYEAITSN